MSGMVRNKVTDLLGLVVRAPRTIPELQALTRFSEDFIRTWLELWVLEGLIKKTLAPANGKRGTRAFRYEWLGAPK